MPESDATANCTGGALAGPWRRRALFFFLYACEGAPFGFIWWMLPVLLREAAHPVERITTLTALATLPWTLKFVAAPFVDYSSSRGLPLRWWIAGAQLAMALSLVPLLGIDLATGYALLLPCLLAHSTLGAVQDVAVDTLAIRATPTAELGQLNGWMQAGMLAGRAATAGLGLAWAERFGTDGVVLGLALLLCTSAFCMPVLLASEPEPERHPLPDLLAELRAVVEGRVFWLAAAFALLAGAAFEAFGALAGALFTDLAWPRDTSAGVFGVLSPGAMVLGALAGGTLADRFGRIRVCGVAVLALAVTSCALTGLPAGGPTAGWQALLTVHYLLVGALTAVSYSLLMQISTGRLLAATQFSVLMALTNACEVWAGFLGGRLTGAWGYAPALATMAVLSLLALPALAALRVRAAPEAGGPGESRRPASRH